MHFFFLFSMELKYIYRQIKYESQVTKKEKIKKSVLSSLSNR